MDLAGLMEDFVSAVQFLPEYEEILCGEYRETERLIQDLLHFAELYEYDGQKAEELQNASPLPAGGASRSRMSSTASTSSRQVSVRRSIARRQQTRSPRSAGGRAAGNHPGHEENRLARLRHAAGRDLWQPASVHFGPPVRSGPL